MQRVLCQCFNIIYFFIDENCLCLTDGECFFSNLQCKIVLKNPIYNCPPLTACRSKSFTRVCHPFPLLRRASKTSASRRMLNIFFCGFNNLRFSKWQGCIFESCSVVRTGQSLVSILSSGIELASHLAINSSKSFIWLLGTRFRIF